MTLAQPMSTGSDHTRGVDMADNLPPEHDDRNAFPVRLQPSRVPWLSGRLTPKAIFYDRCHEAKT